MKGASSDLAFDMAVALRASQLELDEKRGEYWYLGLLDAVFGSAEDTPTPTKDVTWFN